MQQIATLCNTPPPNPRPEIGFLGLFSLVYRQPSSSVPFPLSQLSLYLIHLVSFHLLPRGLVSYHYGIIYRGSSVIRPCSILVLSGLVMSHQLSNLVIMNKNNQLSKSDKHLQWALHCISGLKMMSTMSLAVKNPFFALSLRASFKL